jgi:serine/threonine protein kinase
MVHRRGIVHRDVKADNVLVVRDENGHDFVKLLDFGIARLGASDESHRNLLVGTPHYLAPEAILGGGVGPAADTSVAISLKLVPVAMPAIIRTGSNKILAQFDLIKSSPVKIDLDVCEAFRINSLAEV